MTTLVANMEKLVVSAAALLTLCIILLTAYGVYITLTGPAW